MAITAPIFRGGGNDFSYRGSNNDHIGGMGGLKVGYNFESLPVANHFAIQLALEGEAYYSGDRLSTRSSFGPGDGTSGDFSLHGNMNNVAAMINGLLRVKTGTCFTPYIGAGTGVEFLTFTQPVVSEVGFANEAPNHNANDFAPAVQAIGGFDIELAKHWTLFTEYKYLVAIDPEFNLGTINFGGPGAGFNTKYQPTYMGEHLLSTGIKYNF